MKVEGMALAGTAYPDVAPDIPRGTLSHGHRPWCRDCKRKHEADQLDDEQRCGRCARAAASRAAAAERRATDPESQRVWDEALKAPRGTKKAGPKPGSIAEAAASYDGMVERVTRPDDHIKAPQAAGPAPVPETPVEPKAISTPVPAGAPPRPAVDLAGDLASLIGLIAEERQRLDDIEPALWRLHGLLPAPQAAVRTGEPLPSAGTTSKPPRAAHGRMILPTDDIATAYQNGATLRQLAASYGCSVPTIRGHLTAAGVSIRARGGNQREAS